MKSIQSSLFSTAELRTWERKVHGGDLLKGRRKTRRPMDPRKPLHLVFRASGAKGRRSMLIDKNARPIRHLLEREAKKHGVRVMKFANVGNHLHLVVHAKSRVLFPRFLRAFAGLVARQVLGAERGKAVLRTQEDGTRERFWDARPFSRILEWGKDLGRALDYLTKNQIEAMGWGDLVRPEKVLARLGEQSPSREGKKPQTG